MILMPATAVHINSAQTWAAKDPDLSFGGAGSPHGFMIVLARFSFGQG